MTRDTNISFEKRKQYAAVYLMDFLEKTNNEFLVELDKGELELEPLFEWLYEKSYIEISDKNTYIVSATGKQLLDAFRTRYQSYLEQYDIYCAVDLESGEFAFQYAIDMASDDEWQALLAEDRWDDLRIAVMEHEGKDPTEIVFVGFIEDGRFGYSEEAGWQYDCLLGKVWDEIEVVLREALTIRSLAYLDDGAMVSGEDVLKDVIESGEEILKELRG